MMSPCKGGGGMQPVADLLRRALLEGDEQGRTQIRSQHLPDDVMADLAKQTHQYRSGSRGGCGACRIHGCLRDEGGRGGNTPSPTTSRQLYGPVVRLI
jgi:hypothetical protein